MLQTQLTRLIMSLRFFLSSSGMLGKTSNLAKIEVISGSHTE